MYKKNKSYIVTGIQYGVKQLPLPIHLTYKAYKPSWYDLWRVTMGVFMIYFLAASFLGGHGPYNVKQVQR